MVGTVLDIETTGFLKFDMVQKPNPYGKEPLQVSELSDSCEILEVGFINIDLNTARMLNSGTLYFYKPYFNVESDAQRIHGLTREFLQKYEKDFEKNLIALNALMQGSVIIGKNSKVFDIPVIQAFIKKHSDGVLDITRTVNLLNMKKYKGGYVTYNGEPFSMDMQAIYKDRFHQLYRNKYSYTVKPEMSEEFIRTDLNSKFPNAGEYGVSACLSTLERCKSMNMSLVVYPDKNYPKLDNKKKGTLSQYIEVLDSAQNIVDTLYDRMDKDRVAGVHSALYDAVMTYVIWYDAKINGLFNKELPDEA